MSLIDNIIRPELRAIEAYPVPDAAGLVKLDAMENPYGLPEALRRELGATLAAAALNRYPVPSYAGLKEKIRQRLGVPEGLGILLGNGSDELISIIAVACARPGARVLATEPGFVMYERSAQFAGMEFVGVPLAPGFGLDMEAMRVALRKERPAVVYLAYPNNPTGTLFDADDMAELIEAVGDTGVVVVDEAYQPFAEASFMPRLPEFPNLVVMRTVSKLGMAGIRLGYLAGAEPLLAEFDKVRPPYNINVLTETAAGFLLDHLDVFNEQAAILRSERALLSAALAALPGVEVTPSAANFLLVRLDPATLDSDAVWQALARRKVLVKNVGKMHASLGNCLRVTVSTPEENRMFLDALKASLAL